MKITVFTICSANYLAQAKILGDSLLKYNPNYHFVIGLVDRIEDKVDKSYWQPYELIEVEDINIKDFDKLCQKYNLVELNTAVKPFYIEYLYQQKPDLDSVIYIDPDIFICNQFQELQEKLTIYNIILTPHSCTIDDSKLNQTYEIAMLRTGLYNLGFIATSRSDETFRFLKWWQSRLKEYCFYRPGSGFFVDQIWCNFLPFYFDKVHIETSLGYNVCYWNLFERKINYVNNKYLVNNKYDLIFYHFSSYNPFKPDLISNRGVHHPLSERPDIESIFEYYRQQLLTNDYENLIKLECEFFKSKGIKIKEEKEPVNQKQTIKTLFKKYLKSFFSLFPTKLKQLIKKINNLILESI